MDVQTKHLIDGNVSFSSFPRSFFLIWLVGIGQLLEGRMGKQNQTEVGSSRGPQAGWLGPGARQHPSSWDPNPGMVPCQAKTGLTLKVEATYTQIKHLHFKILEFSMILDVLHMNVQD